MATCSFKHRFARHKLSAYGAENRTYAAPGLRRVVCVCVCVVSVLTHTPHFGSETLAAWRQRAPPHYCGDAVGDFVNVDS